MSETNQRRQPPTRLFALLFASVGLVLASLGLWTGYSSLTLLSTGTAVEGEVVSSVERAKREHDDHVQGVRGKKPGVRFTTPEGKEVTFVSPVAVSSGPEVGDKVSVIYPVGKPELAQINSFFQFWFLPLVQLGIGIPLALISLLVFKFSASSELSREELEKRNATLSYAQRKKVEKLEAILDEK